MRIGNDTVAAMLLPVTRLFSQVSVAKLDMGLDAVDERGMTDDASVAEFLTYLRSLSRRTPARYTSKAA